MISRSFPFLFFFSAEKLETRRAAFLCALYREARDVTVSLANFDCLVKMMSPTLLHNTVAVFSL